MIKREEKIHHNCLACKQLSHRYRFVPDHWGTGNSMIQNSSNTWILEYHNLLIVFIDYKYVHISILNFIRYSIVLTLWLVVWFTRPIHVISQHWVPDYIDFSVPFHHHEKGLSLTLRCTERLQKYLNLHI